MHIPDTNLSEIEGWILGAIHQSNSTDIEEIRYKLSEMGFGPVHDTDREFVQGELDLLKRKGYISNHGLTPQGEEVVQSI